jgi:hypothetical protein
MFRWLRKGTRIGQKICRGQFKSSKERKSRRVEFELRNYATAFGR